MKKSKAKKAKLNIKSPKFTIKNTFTFVVALIIIAVALFWYYNEQRKTNEHYSGLNEIFTDVATVDNGDLNVHFIDVGQGDCIFVEFPDGKNMLIDSGNRGYGDEISTYLNKLGVTDITLVIATHTDADHIGSMEAVFDNYNVGYCLRPFVYYNGDNASEFDESFNLASTKSGSYKCKNVTYYNFLNCILKEECGYSYFNQYSDFSQQLSLDGVTYEYKVDFLTPIAEVNDISYSDSNDYSPIFILTYGEFSIMFTGDAGKEVEEEFLNAYSTIPQIDVLKVGHHGSKTSSTQAFVNKVNPNNSVIMCGQPNSYGHPTQEAITRLYAKGTIWRTDLQGNIAINVKAGGSYKFTYQKWADNSDLITGVVSSK